MGGILSGLNKIGITGLDKIDIYAEPEEKKPVAEGNPAPVIPKITVMTERDYLFPKSHTCPVCYKEFKTPTVRVNKLKPRGVDTDLRPRFEGIDPLKYDIVLCHECGYAALGNYFDKLSATQIKLIKQGISKNYRRISESDTYTYDQAFMRFQLALGNAVVKRAKAGEKAYLCLKMAWILRGKREAIDSGLEVCDEGDYATLIQEIEQSQMELLENAVEGFMSAKSNETFPICGMDKNTLEYIIAVESVKLEKYDIASRMLDGLLERPSVNKVMKKKCEEMKEQIGHLGF
ncbi:MAG: DUF2225 domain-containing protein [Lachnospiraceae bacterium]|nr:DUF2225 domain-containing protein [Lachnospiraceae bacterium]